MIVSHRTAPWFMGGGVTFFIVAMALDWLVATMPSGLTIALAIVGGVAITVALVFWISNPIRRKAA